MMGRAHTKVLVRAAEAAGGPYGELLLCQHHWIEKSAAGRFNDSVLRDWYYKKTPQTVWCLRRLSRAIGEVPPDDEALLAFLLHWTSHYFVDAIWTCHVAQRYMTGASAQELKEFDNGIEREVEQLVETDPAFAQPLLDGRGYWAHFWRGRLASDRRAPALLDAWRRREGYVAIALESVPHCVASFAAYLVSLNARRESTGTGADLADRAHPDNAWVVALHAALERGGTVAQRLAEESPEPRPGPETDHRLDQTGAAFGTGVPQLDAWPGEWVLAQHLSGAQLKEQVFTAEFAAAVARRRGYDRSIEQDQQEGHPPTAAAVADRDRQVALMNAWLRRWDVAVGNSPDGPALPGHGSSQEPLARR